MIFRRLQEIIRLTKSSMINTIQAIATVTIQTMNPADKMYIDRTCGSLSDSGTFGDETRS